MSPALYFYFMQDNRGKKAVHVKTGKNVCKAAYFYLSLEEKKNYTLIPK